LQRWVSRIEEVPSVSDSNSRCVRLVFHTAVAAALIFSVADTADAKARKKKRLKPQPERYAAIVIDADTSEILHARFADSERHPASLTKMMTLYMLFDAIEDGKVKLTDKIPVSARAAGQAPTKLGLKTGSTIEVEDAIRALIVQSANDVAVAVAEKLGGTEAQFSALMTAKAKSIGLDHSKFVNASGLPDARQITTARDVATLSQALMRDFPTMYPYFSTAEMAYGPAMYRNHNRLLGRIEGVDGIKTGYTRMSGFNLSTSAVRDGRRVIAVVMGGASASSRDLKMETLLTAAFDELERRSGTQMASASGQPRIAFSALPLDVQTRPTVSAPAGTASLITAPLGIAASGAPARTPAIVLDGLRGHIDVVPDLY
jgi:D-alanyl-D-alanine carboxypeptidase